MGLEFWQHSLTYFVALSFFFQRKFRLIQVLLRLSQSHPHKLINTRWVHEVTSFSICQATGRNLKPEDSQSCSPDPAKYVCTQKHPVHFLPSHFFTTHLTLSSHLRLDLASGVLPSGSYVCVSFLPYMAHNIPCNSPWRGRPGKEQEF